LIKKIKYPVILASLCILLLFILHNFQFISIVERDSILYSTSLMLINFLLFLVFWEYSKNKSNKIFLIFNLGGMAFRLVLVLITVFVIIKFLNIDKYAFIFALFIWYILFITYEISLFRKLAEKSKNFNKIK